MQRAACHMPGEVVVPSVPDSGQSNRFVLVPFLLSPLVP